MAPKIPTWEDLDGGYEDPQIVPKLLVFLRTLAERDRLGIVTVDWEGCPACNGGSSIYIATLRTMPDRYLAKYPTVGIEYGTLHWRNAYDPDDPDAPPSFQNVVEQSYKLWLWLTSGRRQVFGGHRLVETFLDVPALVRPKFPQLFFLDGYHISVDRIDDLIGLHRSQKLFHPYSILAPSGEIARCVSGDLRLEDPDVHRAVTRALGAGTPQDQSLLLQLTNFHMYRAAGDQNHDFMTDLFLESCDCAVAQYVQRPPTPGMCIRFERRRDV